MLAGQKRLFSFCDAGCLQVGPFSLKLKNHFTFHSGSYTNISLTLSPNTELETISDGNPYLASVSLPLLKTSCSNFRYFHDICGGFEWIN